MSLCKNYNIIDGLAFTKDNILIQKFKLNFLCEYHKNNRNVIIQKKENSHWYIVQFLDPKVAANALKANKSNMCNCADVNALDSQDQPDGQRLINQFRSRLGINNPNYNCCEDENRSSILELNDFCLEHILKYLDLSGQIYFASTCQRLYESFVFYFKEKHQTLDTRLDSGLFSGFKMKIFLEMLGPHFQNYTIDFTDINWLDYKTLTLSEFMKQDCTNARQLKIIGYYGEICEIIKNMPLLEHLSLLFCSVKENDIKCLQTLTNLKSLCIVNNNTRYIISRYKLPALDKLTLTGLEKLTYRRSTPLVAHYNTLINLKYVDIRQSDDDINMVYNPNYYINIANNLLQLETLRLNCSNGDYSCITKLPKLKALDIVLSKQYDKSLTRKLFTNLENDLVDKLEKFGICIKGATLDIEEKEIVSKLKELKVLKWLCKPSVEDVNYFSKLSKLEIFYYNRPHINLIYTLLEKCLKLKKILFCENVEIPADVINTCVSILMNQRALGLRTTWMEFVVESRHSKIFKKYSNVLKIRHKMYIDCYENEEDFFNITSFE